MEDSLPQEKANFVQKAKKGLPRSMSGQANDQFRGGRAGSTTWEGSKKYLLMRSGCLSMV